MTLRLFIHGMRQPLADPRGSSLAFTLAGVYASVIFSIATVYLGLQAIPVLFLITGWAVAYLDSGIEGIGKEVAAPAAPAPAYRFRRIMGAPPPLPAPALSVSETASEGTRMTGEGSVKKTPEARPKPRQLVGAASASAARDRPRVMVS
jgi:hypothetical protein